MIKMYMTKYALSASIQLLEGELTDCGKYLKGRDSNGYRYFHSIKDCFESIDEANAKAEEMRKKKIAALQRHIARLEKMEFK